MRANVFADAALTKQAGRFVWLSIDTEKPKNAPFIAKYPINAWPTLLVVDARSEQVLLRWYGSATAPQLGRLLDDGERSYRAGAAGTGGSPEALLARADRLNGERKFSEAADAYRESLNAGGPNWASRVRAIESLARALQFARRREECARIAAEEAPALPAGSSLANVLEAGLTCALGAADAEPWRATALTRLKPLAEKAVRQPGLLGDDRSNIYDALIGVAEAERDDSRVKALAREWLDFLKEERQRGQTADARAANDGQRVTAALKLGEPARAVPALQASERELPEDYNPPARLAVLYREMGRYDDALSASDRALAKAYGPRRLLIYTQRAQIYQKQGDRAAARRAIEQAIEYAKSLPDGEQRAAALREQLARLH